MPELTSIGTVAALWRFPVKSMLGEELDACELTSSGVVGDRAYAVVDEADGKVASAKHPAKWGRLLELSARFTRRPSGSPEDPVAAVEISFPDGRVVSSDDDVDGALSAFLGRSVRLTPVAPEQRVMEEVWPDIDGLAPPEFIDSTSIGTVDGGEVVSDIAMALAAPAGTFFDLAVLHVITTSTLESLRRHHPAGDFDVRRYRPNVVIESAADGFPENSWAGSTVRLGDDAAMAVSMPTMRCVMTTLAQGPSSDLPRDRSLLQAIARHNRIEIGGLGHWACAGAYGDVAAPGRVATGDPVALAGP